MKTIRITVLAVLLTLSMSVCAFAGQWLQDATGWWYQNDDGTGPVGWAWIDGNHDGIAECYYFNEAGYCLMNTTTPDGYTVDANGAWTINGVVQTQTVAVPLAQLQSTSVAQVTTRSMYGYQGISSTPYEGFSIIVNTNTRKYHYPNCREAAKIHTDNKGYADDAALLEAQGFTSCKVCH